MDGRYTAKMHTEKGVSSYRAAYSSVDGQIEEVQVGCASFATAKSFCQEHYERRIDGADLGIVPWTWTDATFGFDKVPGKTATIDGETHAVYIGPKGTPVWTVSRGKRGQPNSKLLPREADTIDSATRWIEKTYR
jgi:hypothetical protein